MVDRIVAIIREKGLSINAVEKELGFGNGAIKRFATSSPSIDKIVVLSNFLNVSVEYLITGKKNTNELSVNEETLLKAFRKLDFTQQGIIIGKAESLAELSEPSKQTTQTIHKSPIKIHKPSDDNIAIYKSLPIYEEPASAGAGSWIDDNPYEMVQVPLDSVSEKAQYILRVKGDSMEPMFTDGDKIFVNNYFNVQQGDIGIFAYNEDVYVKRLGDGCLISLNDKYEPILIENDSFRTIGKVLGKVEDIRWGRDVGL